MDLVGALAGDHVEVGAAGGDLGGRGVGDDLDLLEAVVIDVVVGGSPACAVEGAGR